MKRPGKGGCGRGNPKITSERMIIMLYTIVSANNAETIKADTIVEAVRAARKYAHRNHITAFHILDEFGIVVYDYVFRL